VCVYGCAWVYVRASVFVCVCARVSVCMVCGFVCMRVRMREREKEREREIMCGRESVCACERERERGSKCVCVHTRVSRLVPDSKSHVPFTCKCAQFSNKSRYDRGDLPDK